MVLRLTIISFVILLNSEVANAQIKYDTTIISSSYYGAFEFKIGNHEMQYFEVNEIDVDINDGEIELKKQLTDTIGIRNLESDSDYVRYEIELSDDDWGKLLFGRECRYLSNEIDVFPTLKISREKSTNRLSFMEPKLIGDFVKTNYEKNIECIDSLGDKTMKKYLVRWISKIDNDSIDIFLTSLTSHFGYIFPLYDIIVPLESEDTVTVTILQSDNGNQEQFAYQVTKSINPDSSININYTDDIKKTTSYQKQFVEMFYEPFAKHLPSEERRINSIRVESMKSVDKSTVILSPAGELKRYIRMIESYILDARLKPKRSFHNYEIRKIDTFTRR